MGLDMSLYVNGEEEIYWRKDWDLHKFIETLVDPEGGIENCKVYTLTNADLDKISTFLKERDEPYLNKGDCVQALRERLSDDDLVEYDSWW